MQTVLETLSVTEKRLLLANLLEKGSSQPQLSLTQERLWRLCQMQPGTPLYNFQTSLELQGPLLPKLVERAASQVIARHQALQTSYAAKQGRPHLCFSAPQPAAIALHDLSRLPEEEQEQRMKILGMEDAQHSFDLDNPPLLRLALVRLAPEKHRLYLTMHHIVSDFLSLDLFLFELGAFYSAALTGRPCDLPPLLAGYQNFARMQRSAGTVGENVHLEYWRRVLAAAQPIEWFSDHPRPAAPTGKGGTEFFSLPSSLMHKIGAFARQQRTTPFMVLLAGFNILLHACSWQSDLTVGVPMAGRNRSEDESLIGMFSYPVLMRANVTACEDFRALLQKVRRVVLEATEHADVPFAKISDCAQGAGVQPASLLRAMFSFVSQLRDLRFGGLTCRRRPTDRGVTDLDLFMTIYPDLNEWHAVLEYSADLFEQATIRALIPAYLDILQAALADPGLSVAALAARVPVKTPARLNIGATFTADPLLEVFKFWSRELDLQFTPVIAPYNQLLQQLLDPQGIFSSPGSALNAVLVRPEDWIQYTHQESGRQEQMLEQSTRDFIAAVQKSILSMNCPLNIYICPSSRSLRESLAAAVVASEQKIRETFSGSDRVKVLNGQACSEIYASAEIHDPQTNLTANIPYKSAFYAALGTQITRRLRAQLSRPVKVLALDCDNTLWQGLCAEGGAHGVVITEGHRALQEFVRQQAASGVLICLVSKNAPEDVLAVFRENPGMILKEADITTSRINWEPKSCNLESLAEELRLGLDSFVFLDDDARECAEVSVRCPRALTINLPRDPAELPRFIQHLWIFDREGLSEEDRRRAAFYRDNKCRDLALQQAPSLEEFLATLELRVEVRPAAPGQLARIAQLTHRTNQFNASGIIFNDYQLERGMQQGLKVLAVEVNDRFGDYGMAGAVMYREDGKFLVVEAFYLSCRVLGRGVEHRILSELGRASQIANLEHVRIHYNESSRNYPFHRFLEQLPGQWEQPASGPWAFVLTTEDALNAKFMPQKNALQAEPQYPTVTRNRETRPGGLTIYARLPHELSSAAQILRKIDLSGSSSRALRIPSAFAAPQDGLESSIATEWSKILRLDKVGRNDNFFELGGNSLLMVQLNGGLIEKLGRDISLPKMFQYPTVASLARHIAGPPAPETQTPEPASRGAKARAVLQSRKCQRAVFRDRNMAGTVLSPG